MDPEIEDEREEEANEEEESKEEEEEGRESEADGANEEDGGDFFGDLKRHLNLADVEEERKKSALRLKISKYKKKKENPLRAELYTRIKSFVKSDVGELRKVIEFVNYENGEELLARKKMSSRGDDINYKILRVVKHVLDTMEEDPIFVLICELNLIAAIVHSEVIEWSAFELKKNRSDPNIEFMRTPDDDALPEQELRTIKRAIRAELNTTLAEEASTKDMFMRFKTQDKFLMIAVMEVITSRGSARTGRLKCPCVVLAFNPKVPLVCVHAKNIREDLLLKIVASFPGGYGAIRNVGLKDVGLILVYNNFLRVNSAALATSQEFKNRIAEEEKEEQGPFVQDEKRRRIVKNLLDDKQEGFKNFTIQYEQAKDPARPIIFKFKAQKGNLNEHMKDMYERRLWNSVPYVMARDRKQNSIKVKTSDHLGFKAVAIVDSD